MVSWDDAIILIPNKGRYLSTKKLQMSLVETIHLALGEMSQENENITITCKCLFNHITLIVNLNIFHKLCINILPTICVNRTLKSMTRFDDKIRNVFRSFLLSDKNVEKIALVAIPMCSDEQFLWCITFNDMENGILNSSNFVCAHHCLYILDLLCGVYQSREMWNVLRYHLQNVVLLACKSRPHPKHWRPGKLQKRLKQVILILCNCLRRKRCRNVFTNVNIFSHFDDKSLKKLATQLSKIKVSKDKIENVLQH